MLAILIGVRSRTTQTENRRSRSVSSITSLATSCPAAAATTAAAKPLQSCPTLCNPIYGSPPGSPSLGFSRQEHWSGLPFPFPMYESEKGKWSHSVVSDSSRPHGLQPTRLFRPWDFPSKSTGVGIIIKHWNMQEPLNLFNEKIMNISLKHDKDIKLRLSMY